MFENQIRVIAVLILLLLPVESFATATLNCVGNPYFFVVHYSLSHGAQSFQLANNNETLIEGSTKTLRAFSLSWPENEQSARNNISFSGYLKNGKSFTGEASANTGKLTVNEQNFRFKCDWLR